MSDIIKNARIKNILEILDKFSNSEKVIVLNIIIQELKNSKSIKENSISDGYHTFDELYDIRKAYNVALFNEWGSYGGFDFDKPIGERAISKPLYDVHKSLKHYDGELCFGGGWFIVVANLPTGQISNHYKIEDWDLFKIPEVEKAKYEFDGHTTKDVIERLLKL